MSAADSSDRIAEDPPAPSARRATHERPVRTRSRGRIGHFFSSLFKQLATVVIAALAILAALIIWDEYVTAPWTRDGRVRVQVASVAPQVSGQIIELKVSDNQYVHKGDVLYMIDPFDFQVALNEAKQTLEMKAADLEVKRQQSDRRKKLSDLATTPEEQQQYAGNAIQARAAFESAQSQVAQADINLKRTEVQSPVNGYVTNLLMRVGDYAHAGTANVSVIDADSYWIDGYFEETKLAHVCIGDRAEAQLMGFAQPIVGQVQTITRGISVSDAAPSTQGLPNVNPVYTWVRLAERVPVRIAIKDVPPGVPLVSGLTATVTIRDAEARAGDDGWAQRWTALNDRVHDIFQRPKPNPSCVPAMSSMSETPATLSEPEAPPKLNPSQIAPDVAPGLTRSPKL